MPATKPVMPKAATAFRSPVFERINFAIVTADPVLSSIIAIIAPSMIRKPVEAIVLPKPSFIIMITSLPGITAIARKRDTRKREIKALSFHFEVSKIIDAILIITRVDIATVLMFQFKGG